VTSLLLRKLSCAYGIAIARGSYIFDSSVLVSSSHCKRCIVWKIEMENSMASFYDPYRTLLGATAAEEYKKN
jgi:hypothetical protein